MKRIIITGAGGVAGLGFTRCLKAAPEKMFLLGTDSNERFIHFAETDQRALIPKCDSLKYIDVLKELIDSLKIELVHAQPDSEISVISENREKLDAIVFLPSKKSIDICQNKFESAGIWKKKGVPTAETVFINKEDDIRKAFEMLGRPLWFRAIRGAGGKGSLLINEHDHARAWIDFWKGWGNFTASEYLPGSNFGWDSIFKNGELVCCQTKERLEYVLPRASPSGVTGTTGVAKAIERKDINEIAENAVRAIDPDPDGVFAVDLKEKAGVPYVTEINPGRFLSSSVHFFYMAKSNLPHLYIKIAYKETVRPEDIPKKIKGGTVLVRTLDKGPMIFDGQNLKELAEKRDKYGHVIV